MGKTTGIAALALALGLAAGGLANAQDAVPGISATSVQGDLYAPGELSSEAPETWSPGSEPRRGSALTIEDESLPGVGRSVVPSTANRGAGGLQNGVGAIGTMIPSTSGFNPVPGN